MKMFMMALIMTLMGGFGAYAGEMVGFVTHKVVIDDAGNVKSLVPMKSEIVVSSDNGDKSTQAHHKAMEKALTLHMNKDETLFDFAGAFNKAVDKTVSVVSTDTFKGIAAGAAAVGAAAIAAGAYVMDKKTKKEDDDLFYKCVAITSNVNDCATKYNIKLDKKN